MLYMKFDYFAGVDNKLTNVGISIKSTGLVYMLLTYKIYTLTAFHILTKTSKASTSDVLFVVMLWLQIFVANANIPPDDIAVFCRYNILADDAQCCFSYCRYQGLSAVGNPDLLEQFVSQHQCNYYCGLLGLRSLKPTDSLQTPSSKSRGSKSPLLQRKTAAGTHSPGTARRAALSPRLPRKADGEQDRSKSPM